MMPQPLIARSAPHVARSNVDSNSALEHSGRAAQMTYRTRTYYTHAQKALMWERWKEGWTLHQIAQLFNRAHTLVQGILSRTGGPT